MDEAVAQVIKQMNITIPIVHIKDSNYLVGSQRLNLVIKRDSLLVQKGGGSQKFDVYIAANNKFHQRNLVIYMIQTGESLEYVVDSLINGKKFKQIETVTNRRSSNISTNQSRRTSVSPGEKRYRQQKDAIMEEMQKMLNTDNIP